jgi:hypothetical protein
VALKPRYEIRWLQTRPAGSFADEALPPSGLAPTPPCNVPNVQPQRGPWRGFFAGNLAKTNIINAFNTGDQIVQYVWRIMQLEQKPNYSNKGIELGVALVGLPAFLANVADPSIDLFSIFPAEAGDSRAIDVWGEPPFSSPAENTVFGDGQSHSNIVRQWAEITQWYPSLTDSIGVINNFATAVGKAQNDDLDLTPFGNTANSGGLVRSHTYLYEAPFTKVRQGFVLLKSRLQ